MFSTHRSTIYSILREAGYEFSSDKPKHDLVGQRFGYLEVVQMARTSKSKGGVWRAICKCLNCGNPDFDANVQNMIRGSVTSCGCRKDHHMKMRGSSSPRYTGYKEISGSYWGKVKKGALRRSIQFSISLEYAWKLFKEQDRRCYLSGLPLRFRTYKNRDQTASLDRIDSSKGYIQGNIAWAHKDVNVMKGLMNKDYFIGMCSRICGCGRLTDEEIGRLRGKGTGYGINRRNTELH